MANMAVRHVRRHWKKYVVGQLFGMTLTSYLISKYRERNIIREQCNVAKAYGEAKVSMLDRPQKIIVFLNQKANNSDAKIQFTKYVAPLLYLSGMDVTVVESEYQGQIQMLMQYISPSTDGIVIAGGDGTIMEVLNGLMRRQDRDTTNSIVLGILPLGKENQSFRTLFPSSKETLRARWIGEATLKIIHGLTKKVPVMEIQPEKGKTLFALSSIQWGVFKEALDNRDRFWVFGKLRLLMSHISTALRHWPEGEGCRLSLWVPQSSMEELQDGGPLEEDGHKWLKIEEDITGFNINLTSPSHLSIITWPLALISKSMFLKHGWCLTTKLTENKPPSSIDYKALECVVVPPVTKGDQAHKGWVSVDGEDYEPISMAIKLQPKFITIFT